MSRACPVQDPVARAFSAWQMTMRELCPRGPKNCKVKSFEESVKAELAAEEARGCLFNATVCYCHLSCVKSFIKVNQGQKSEN